MLKSLLGLILLSPPLFGETLLSGAMYFDSENTLLEVQNLLKAGDTDGLARLFKNKHISEKVNQNLEVILLLSRPDGVEFRFANNPTTYWTYPNYVTVNVPKSTATPAPTTSLSAGPNSALPADFLSSLTSSSIHLPAAMPSPTPTPPPPPPIPTPTPKVRVATVEEKEEEREAPPPLRRRHYRTKESDEEGVPEKYKVWHQVNGHWKWYDKRNLHEVRRALPVSATPIAAAPVGQPNLPTGTAIPNPNYRAAVPAPATPRTQPNQPARPSAPNQ
jgi:hypothetical protein